MYDHFCKLRDLSAKKAPTNCEGAFLVVLFILICYYGFMDGIIQTVISAGIAAVASIIGSYLSVQRGNHEREIRDAKREQSQADRLNNIDNSIAKLERKVDIHNGYAEKFGIAAKEMAVMARDIEYTKEKLDRIINQ